MDQRNLVGQATLIEVEVTPEKIRSEKCVHQFHALSRSMVCNDDLQQRNRCASSGRIARLLTAVLLQLQLPF